MDLGLGKIKEVMKLQKQANEMNKKMKAISIRGECKGEDVVVVINGLREIEDMDFDDSLLNPDSKDILIKKIKEAFEDASKKLEKELRKNMDMNELMNMLKGQ